LAINILHDITRERREEQRLSLLTEASAILTASLEYPTALAAVARVLVPRLGDCTVVQVIEDRKMRLIAVHADADKQPLLDRLTAEPRAVDDPRELPRPLQTGRATLMPEVPSDLLEALGARVGMSAPMSVRGDT